MTDSPYERPPNRRADLVTCTWFLASVALPCLAQLVFGGNPNSVLHENRAPARAPTAPRTAAEWAALPKAVDAYVNDQFTVRTTLVRAHNRIKYHGFRCSPAKAYTRGRDGWLFYTPGDERMIPGWRGVDPFTPAELSRWREHLEANERFFGARGIIYQVVIAPNKLNVYPEQLPPSLNKVGPTRLDQWLDAFKDSSVEPLDLRGVLTDAKPRQRVYYPLGTHWNDWGAYLTYVRLIERLRERGAPIGPALSEEQLSKTEAPVGETLGVQLLLPELVRSTMRLDPRRSGPPRQLPKAVIVQDSFGGTWRKFLSTQFELVETPLDREAIARENPAVVIHERVQRSLVNVPKAP